MPRRIPVALAIVVLAALQLLVSGPAGARAASPTTLNVVGTSDVYDSNLIQQVIKPGFEQAYPNFSLNYISKGTGAAITYAEAGTADALVVHAASLENQFVSQGYSLEPYGRAIFWGDFVLLGPASDPAGVMADGANDAVKAFEDIAAAGAAGKADFVSRGGTPGTTVEEHKIWSLTSGVTTCDVSDTNGGGTSPSTTTGACPTSIDYPSWYHATGLTQGPNILQANTCNYGNGNDCYVLTDRGTYQYLTTQSPAPTNLQVVTADNSASATGGSTLLVNSFHAYAINPAKFPGTTIQSQGAVDLLNYITSSAGQTAIGNYLSGAAGGAPFIPDAAPKVTVNPTNVPDLVYPRAKVTVSGSIANVVPGTPALNKKRVTLMGQVTATPSAKPVVIASAVTDANGAFTMSFQPPVTRSYSLVTPALTKIEDASLNPQFVDMLQPTSTNLGTTVVHGALHQVRATGNNGAIRVTGDLYPRVHGDGGVLRLYAKVAGRGHSYHYIGGRALSNGQRSFDFSFPQAARSYTYFVRYVNPGFIEPAQSANRSVTVVS